MSETGDDGAFVWAIAVEPASAAMEKMISDFNFVFG